MHFELFIMNKSEMTFVMTKSELHVNGQSPVTEVTFLARFSLSTFFNYCKELGYSSYNVIHYLNHLL